MRTFNTLTHGTGDTGPVHLPPPSRSGPKMGGYRIEETRAGWAVLLVEWDPSRESCRVRRYSMVRVCATEQEAEALVRERIAALTMFQEDA